jgi:vacuolar-type H+-ATPase subunit C/Vma6
MNEDVETLARRLSHEIGEALSTFVDNPEGPDEATVVMDLLRRELAARDSDMKHWAGISVAAAYKTGLADGKRNERERIATAIEAEAAKYPRSHGMGLPTAARIARSTESD